MSSSTQIRNESHPTTFSYKAFIAQEKVMLLLVFGLAFIGFLIEIGPKWHPNLIQIVVAPGNGITEQDIAALIPLSLAAILSLMILRKYLPLIHQQIIRSPNTAFRLALVLGLGVGLILGIGLGVLFKEPLVHMVKHLLRPLQTFFYG